MSGAHVVSRSQVALSLFLVGTLAACDGLSGKDLEAFTEDWVTLGNWKQMHQPYANQVELLTLRHEIGFQDDKAELPGSERQRLLDFVARSNIGGADRVILVGPRTDHGYHHPLTAARLQSVRAELARLGILADVEDDIAAQRRGRVQSTALVVDRAVVIPPNCDREQPGPGQRPEPKPGCANALNLGLMVADPRDLLRGRPIGPGDGEFMSRGVEQYRIGEEEELIEVESATDGGE